MPEGFVYSNNYAEIHLDKSLARLALELGGPPARRAGGTLHPERKPSNLELVKEAVALANEVGRPIATPADAARIMRLPEQ